MINRQNYGSLQNTDDAAVVEKNKESFRVIYRSSPETWRQSGWTDCEVIAKELQTQRHRGTKKNGKGRATNDTVT